MAILIGQQMDFNGLQVLNLVFHSSANASPPATPVEGMAWWVTDQDKLKLYSGSVWESTVMVANGITTVIGYIPQWGDTVGKTLGTGLQLVTTVGGTGSDSSVPTEQAVREAIADALSSEVSFKGGYDANTNTPDLDSTPISTAAGDMYYVTAAGTFFTEAVEIGDVLIANQINATALAHWTRIQKNLGSPVTVAQGGTGLATLTQYGIMIGAGTSNVAFVAAVATAGLVLKNVSASANPAWSTSTYAEASAAGKILRASGASAWAESTITIVDAFAQGGIPHASTANNLTSLAISGTAGTFLRSTATLPAWSTLVLPNSLVQWGMLYAGTADNFTGVIAAAGTTGMFLRGTSGAAPAWSTLILPNAAAVGDLLQATSSNTLAVLNSVSIGSFLTSQGVTTASAWSTLKYPYGTVAIGDIPYASTTLAISMLTSVATAGSFLRGGGTSTAPAWSTVKLPDTMSALGIWVANTANTVVNLTVTALQSIRLNSGGTAWEAYTPGGGSAHAILDGSTHSDSVAGTVARGTMIVGNSTPKWSLLAFQASGASGYVLATDSADTAWKKQRYVEKLSTSATSYDIVHNLGTRRVQVLCQDTTNNQNILIDWACKSGSENTTVTVYFGTAPSSNTRIITVFGINFGNALDTAN